MALLGINQISASAVAAILIGFCGGTMSRRFRLPPLVVAVSGLTPLLPGLTSYQAMFELAVQRSPTGVSTLMLAVATALALAAGVVLGEYLAEPVRTGIGRLERRLSGPRLVGPPPAGMTPAGATANDTVMVTTCWWGHHGDAAAGGPHYCRHGARKGARLAGVGHGEEEQPR